jgi:nucleoside-diphosphate-sugar epimerase
MRVLIAGGAGYLGSAVVDHADWHEHEVRVFDALMYTDLYQSPVEFVYGNVIDNDVMLEQLAWADAVIWLAALVGDAACEAQSQFAQLVNADAVEWMVKNFDGRIVFPSTCSVYGQSPDLIAEDGERLPLSTYARTKCEAEDHLEGANAVVFRLGTLFGLGGQFGRFRMDLAINGMTVQAAKQRKISVHGGDQWRPFLHVQDAAKAMIMALNEKGVVEPGVYNLVGENLQISTLAEMLAIEVPGLQIDWGDAQDADPRDYHVLGEKARDKGITSDFSVTDGIREIKAIVRSGRLARADSPQFHNRESQRANHPGEK